uniref:Peptidase_M16_C domain-containing protein n=1 Tax=Heterorhabditis bacteriophora TaxID=37862 RepID=A0A1I7WYR3_HETBA
MDIHRDTGLFGIYFVSNGHDLSDSTGIMKSIQHEWKHLAISATEDEIQMACNQLRTIVYQNLETNTQKADFNAKELLYTGKIRSLAEIEEAIANVDNNMVKRAVCNHVYDRDIACAGVGEFQLLFVFCVLCTFDCSTSLSGRTEAFMNYAHTRYGMSWWRL